MTEAVDPVTVALTGHLPFYFVLAALVTWPASLALLSLYGRSVHRSMRTSASSATSAMRAQGLAGVIAFAAYKVCVRVGLRWAGRDGLVRQGPALLVLRSFSIGKEGERLFDVIDRFWRRVGAIHMIAGVDLARRTVEPHEFLDFLAGKLDRRFIDSIEAMERRLRECDMQPDRELRFGSTTSSVMSTRGKLFCRVSWVRAMQS